MYQTNPNIFFSISEQSKSKFHPPAATATSATSPAATPTTTAAAAASLRRNGPVDGSPHTKIPEPASGESATSGGQPAAAASGRTESHVRVDEQRPVAEPHPAATAIDQFTSAAPTSDSNPAAAAAAASDVQLDAQSNWSPVDGGGSGQCG